MIDNLLNRITMYRIVLYYLIFLVAVAVALSAVGILTFDPFALLLTTGFLVGVSSLANWIFARAYHVPANAESTYISALILALILTPYQGPHDLWFFGWAAVWAMASKYMVAIQRKHIFNPVAFAVALTYIAINQSASWWVGSAPMLPFVLAGGLVVLRKLERTRLALSFLVAAFATTLVLGVLNGDDLISAVPRLMLYSPLFFFAFVILTEPLTTPPAAAGRVIYGMLTGVLFSPQTHFGALYTTPEIAILVANVFSYLISPRQTLVLQLVRKVKLAPDIYDFVFAPQRKFAFAPGQYMEWTLGHSDPDSRGNRRFFTLASSPTEDNVRLGVKFNPGASTFKQKLLALDARSEIVATDLAGDFTLPRNPNQKCVFIAGGIGITPFRSMIKYLLDTRTWRPIVLFYVARSANELVYLDLFDRARKELGIKTVYCVTDKKTVPPLWNGRTGHITPDTIRTDVPDYGNCIFYISGPKGMVDTFRQLLRDLGVKENRIKTDAFSGLA